VGSYTLSREADADIQHIAEISSRQWGLARAEKYILDMHETFQVLVEFPDLGRDASHIRPGYRKIEAGSHSAFYSEDRG
jgi:toxin ParE1/3/4